MLQKIEGNENFKKLIPALQTQTGDAYFALKKMEEACAAYALAQEADPECAPAFFNCANACKALGQMEDAAQNLSRAAEALGKKNEVKRTCCLFVSFP